MGIAHRFAAHSHQLVTRPFSFRTATGSLSINTPGSLPSKYTWVLGTICRLSACMVRSLTAAHFTILGLTRQYWYCTYSRSYLCKAPRFCMHIIFPMQLDLPRGPAATWDLNFLNDLIRDSLSQQELALNFERKRIRMSSFDFPALRTVVLSSHCCTVPSNRMKITTTFFPSPPAPTLVTKIRTRQAYLGIPRP